MFMNDQIKIDYYENRTKAVISDKKTGEQLAYFKFDFEYGWLEKDASQDQPDDWFSTGYEQFGELSSVVFDWIADYTQYQKEEGEN